MSKKDASDPREFPGRLWGVTGGYQNSYSSQKHIRSRDVKGRNCWLWPWLQDCVVLGNSRPWLLRLFAVTHLGHASQAVTVDLKDHEATTLRFCLGLLVEWSLLGYLFFCIQTTPIFSGIKTVVSFSYLVMARGWLQHKTLADLICSHSFTPTVKIKFSALPEPLV